MHRGRAVTRRTGVPWWMTELLYLASIYLYISTQGLDMVVPFCSFERVEGASIFSPIECIFDITNPESGPFSDDNSWR